MYNYIVKLYFFALVLNLLKDFFERSKISFDRLRTSAGKKVFLAMIVGMYCVQSVRPMEPEKWNGDTKNDVAIEMYHFWSNDYNQNINNIKNVDLKEIRSTLNKEDFLSSSDDTLKHLLYLSTIRKNDDKTLFTQKQQNKFDAAFKTKQSVPMWFGINGAVIVGTSLLPCINFTGLLQCSNATLVGCLSQLVTITTPTVASVAGALTVGFVSLYATGLSPDYSSRKANKVQDEIGHLRTNYATIAKYWIDIYFKYPEKAQYIAQKIDIEALRTRAQLKTHKKRSGSSLVTPLEEAWHFITHKTVLITFTEIENYLYNKMHSQDIDLFKRRIESLESIIYQQNAEIQKLKQEKI